MASTVKAYYIAGSSVVTTQRTRVRGLYALCSQAPSDFTLSDRTSAADYNIRMRIGGLAPIYMHLPSDGVLFPTGVSVSAPTSITLTIFYEGA